MANEPDLDPFAKYLGPAGPEEDPFAKYLVPTKPSADPQGLFKAAGSGIVHEWAPGIAGLPADLTNLAGRAITGNEQYQAAPNWLPTSEGVKSAISSKIPEYQPRSGPEEMMKSIGSYLPNAALGPEAWASPAGALKSAVKYGAVPGAASELAGEAAQKWAPAYEPAARTIAGITSPGLFSRGVTRFPVASNDVKAQDYQNMLNILKQDANIGKSDLGVASYTNRPDRLAGEAKAASRNFSFTSPEEYNANFDKKFTKGAMRYGGYEAENGLPENMQAMQARNNGEFRRLAGTYDLPFSQNLQNRWQQASQDYLNHAIKPSGDIQDAIANVDKMAHQANLTGIPGFLSGEQYISIRSQLGDAMANAKPHEIGPLSAMRNALDDEMEHVIGFYNNGDVGAFQRVRNQYRNELTLRRAVADNPKGTITPDSLAGAIKAHGGTDDYVMGRHPMEPYARAGQVVFNRMPATDPGKDELWRLGLLLGAEGTGAAVGATGSNELQEKTGAPWYLAPMIGALSGYGIGKFLPMLGGGSFAKPIRGARANQIYQPGVANPAYGMDVARALSEGVKQKEKPPSQ